MKQLEDQNVLIKRLQNRVNTLEGRIVELETNIAVTTTVNNNLRVMVDNQEQYSHRPCMVVVGMVTPDKDISNNDDQEAIVNIIQKETGIPKDTIRENIDKMHPIGKPKQRKQQQIIKFKTDSFKEVVYRKHKIRIKMTKQNQLHDNTNVGTRSNGIKFKPLLTKRRINLLEYANIVVKDIKDINLKMMFNEAVNRKFAHAFNSKMELTEMITKIDHEDPSDMYSYDES